MQGEILVVLLVCHAFAKAQTPTQEQPGSSPIKISRELQLKSKLQALQSRFLNKTVDLNEIKRYASVIYRNYTKELQKSIKVFHQVFEPHLKRKNGKKKIKKCAVRQEKQKMGRGVVPRRVKIGVCGASPCSSSYATCSCEPSKVAFKPIMVKICRRKRRYKRLGSKVGGRRKPRKGYRCTWRTDVILSAVACECKC